jgi:plasmid maintenance system antidote protein VapI
MIPSNRTATHPGEVLRDEFLAELGILQTELAAKLGIPVQPRRVHLRTDCARPRASWC